MDLFPGLLLVEEASELSSSEFLQKYRIIRFS